MNTFQKELNHGISAGNHLGCFGNFTMIDPICRKHCALRLRCAIESDHKEQMEILEDLASFSELNLKGH